MSTSASVLRPAHQTQSPTRRLRPLPAPRLLDVEQAPGTGGLYLTLREGAPSHISNGLLDELTRNGQQLRAGEFGAIRYRVLLSAQPGVFSLGGDLGFFLACIRARDAERLLAYGLSAVDGVWDNLSGCGMPGLSTIAVVQGEAQGGGFEAALSCHTIVAERGSLFGFPESLFGLFPGMGALSLLAARTDMQVAERMIAKSHRYSAELLFDLGLVDYLVPKGEGRRFAEEMISLDPSPAMVLRRKSLSAIRYNTLVSSVEHWVGAAMQLPARHLRIMGYLLEAQRRRQQASEPLPRTVLHPNPAIVR